MAGGSDRDSPLSFRVAGGTPFRRGFAFEFSGAALFACPPWRAGFEKGAGLPQIPSFGPMSYRITNVKL